MTWQQEFESSLREGYESRKLDEFIPELLPYLSSGMRVLDVGCGFGGLSMQVAQAVAPGAVEGIDPTESREPLSWLFTRMFICPVLPQWPALFTNSTVR